MSKISINKEVQPAPELPSAKKAAFKAMIERYKVQNPVKYASKKEALEKQLAKL